MVKSGQVWTGSFATQDSTGALLASMTAPTAVLYVNGVSNAAAVTVTGSNPYKWSVTLPALTAGDTVEIYASATIATIPVSQYVAAATADTSRPSDVAAELAKVPKSDSTVSWNATALAAILAQVNAALNVAIPGSPTADSINERVKAIDDRVLGTLATGTHNPQTGDAYARLGAAGAGLTALGDTRLANLDATVSSRNATTPPTAAANATAAAAEILVTPANKLATGAAGVVTPSGGTINSVLGSIGGKVLGGGSDTITGIGAQVASSGGGLTAQQTRDAMLLAPTAGPPADGSVDDHLDDLATALAAATATLTVVSAVDGDVLTIYQAVSFQATISGMAIPAGWSKLWLTVKADPAQADTDAIIQMIETNPAAVGDGLLRLNGAAGTAANGTLTVSQAAGTVVIDLVDEVTDDLALATGLHWSLKALASGGATTLLAIGTLNVRGQATMAVA